MSQVCIFPLPEVALFPHAVLPLHVFESRYRDLLRDCLAGDSRLAVAALAEGFTATDYHGRPPVRPLCGLGEVVAHEALDDGRSNILIRGLARVRILDELPPDRSYRIVNYQLLDDEYPDAFDGARAIAELVLLADQIALKLPSGADTLRNLARSESEAGPLCDVLAAALVTEPAERQLLLETTDVRVRFDQVSTEMAAILTRFTTPRGAAN